MFETHPEVSCHSKPHGGVWDVWWRQEDCALQNSSFLKTSLKIWGFAASCCKEALCEQKMLFDLDMIHVSSCLWTAAMRPALHFTSDLFHCLTKLAAKVLVSTCQGVTTWAPILAILAFTPTGLVDIHPWIILCCAHVCSLLATACWMMKFDLNLPAVHWLSWLAASPNFNRCMILLPYPMPFDDRHQLWSSGESDVCLLVVLTWWVWVLGTAWAWRPLWTMDECLAKEVERRWLSRVESLILGCWLHSSAISFQESSDVFLVDFKGNTGIPTPTDLGTNYFNSAPNLHIWHQNLNLHFRFCLFFPLRPLHPPKARHLPPSGYDAGYLRLARGVLAGHVFFCMAFGKAINNSMH